MSSTPEELEVERLKAMMRTPSPEPCDDMSPNDSLSASVLQDATSTAEAWAASTLRIELDHGRRLANLKKLHPYQRDAVEAMIKVW